MGGLVDILNKVVTVEMKAHENYWIEYVGELRFSYEGKQYHIGEYVKYLCKREKGESSKLAIETGDMVVLSSFDIMTIKVNPKPMTVEKEKKKKTKKED